MVISSQKIHQHGFECMPGPVQAGHDRTGRYFEGPGDSGVAHVFIYAKEKDGFLIGRKAVKSLEKLFFFLMMYQGILRIIPFRCPTRIPAGFSVKRSLTVSAI